eukprot:ANDGO_04560.mRNA.1 kelch repeat protein
MRLSILQCSGDAPSARFAHATCFAPAQHDNSSAMFIVSCGFESGRLSRGCSKSMHALDSHNDQWTDLSALPPQTPSSATESTIGATVGGSNSILPMSPKTGVSEGPTARMRHSVVCTNGQLIVFGGIDGMQDALNDTWSFDLGKREWKLMFPVSAIRHMWRISKYPSPRYGHVCFVVRSDTGEPFMFLMGGVNREGHVQRDLWCLAINSKMWIRLFPPAPGDPFANVVSAVQSVKAKLANKETPEERSEREARVKEQEEMLLDVPSVYSSVACVGPNDVYIYGGDHRTDLFHLRVIMQSTASPAPAPGPSGSPDGKSSRNAKPAPRAPLLPGEKTFPMGDTVLRLHVRKLTPAPAGVSSAAFIPYGPNIILYGGTNQYEAASNHMFVYSVPFDVWSVVPLQSASGVSCPALDSLAGAYDSYKRRILFFGGRDKNTFVSHVMSFEYHTSFVFSPALCTAVGCLPYMRKHNMSRPIDDVLKEERREVVRKQIGDLFAARVSIRNLKDFGSALNAIIGPFVSVAVEQGGAARRRMTLRTMAEAMWQAPLYSLSSHPKSPRKGASVPGSPQVLFSGPFPPGYARPDGSATVEESILQSIAKTKRVRRVVHKIKKTAPPPELVLFDEMTKKLAIKAPLSQRRSLSLGMSRQEDDGLGRELSLNPQKNTKMRNPKGKAVGFSVKHAMDSDADSGEAESSSSDSEYEYHVEEIVESDDDFDESIRVDQSAQQLRASTVYRSQGRGTSSGRSRSSSISANRSRGAVEEDEELRRREEVEKVKDIARSVCRKPAVSPPASASSARDVMAKRLEAFRLVSSETSNNTFALNHPKPPRRFSVNVNEDVYAPLRKLRRAEFSNHLNELELQFHQRVDERAVHLIAVPEYNVGVKIVRQEEMPSKRSTSPEDWKKRFKENLEEMRAKQRGQIPTKRKTRVMSARDVVHADIDAHTEKLAHLGMRESRSKHSRTLSAR